LSLSKIRASARILLTLSEKDPRRIIQGKSLIKRLIKYGILTNQQDTLDHILSLNVCNLLNRRLQTIVWMNGMSNSIHHARVLIKQRHISVDGKLVDIPSFLVSTKSQQNIQFFSKSPLGGGLPGRVRRKTLKKTIDE